MILVKWLREILILIPMHKNLIFNSYKNINFINLPSSNNNYIQTWSLMLKYKSF